MYMSMALTIYEDSFSDIIHSGGLLAFQGRFESSGTAISADIGQAYGVYSHGLR